MRLHVIARYIGFLLLINTVFIAISCLIALFMRDSGLYALLYTLLVSFIFGIFPIIYVPSVQDITKEEGFLIIIGGWLITCMVGSLP